MTKGGGCWVKSHVIFYMIFEKNFKQRYLVKLVTLLAIQWLEHFESV